MTDSPTHFESDPNAQHDIDACKRPTMLLVLGVHRSGTSVTARLLECLGGENSSNLVPANPGNPKGYFEDFDVYHFNETELLVKLGLTWQSIGFPDWGLLNANEEIRLKEQALEIIRKNYNSSAKLSIFKEPRVGVLLPFWLSVIEQAGYTAKIVCAVRDPLSVSRSLQKRNGYGIAHGCMLFVSNWMSILAGIKGLPTAFVQFDDIFIDPRKALRAVADKLSIVPPDDFGDRLKVFSQDFLDSALRHNRIDRDALRLEPGVPPLALELYDALCEATRSQNLESATEFLPTGTAALSPVEPVLGHFDQILAELDAALRANESLTQESEKKVAVLERETQQLRQDLAEQDQELIRTREQDIAALEAEREQRLRVEENAARQILVLKQNLAERLEEVGLLQKIFAERRRESLLATILNHPLVKSPGRWITARARARKLRQRIAESGLFDPAFYVEKYPDVAASGIGPLDHYIQYGASILRDPHPLFCTRYYNSSFPEGSQLPAYPLLDYLESGWQQRRNPHPLFDVEWYLASYPDVAGAKLEPLGHYLKFGAPEGRMPHPCFQASRILADFPHLHEENINPLQFYIGREWDVDPCPDAGMQLLERSQPVRLGDRAHPAVMAVDPAKKRRPKGPLVSVVVAAYNTPGDCLRAMAESVFRQTYSNWELCIADDGSKSGDVAATLQALAQDDHRVRIRILPENGGISVATNAALEFAQGDYVAFVDHDDALDPRALELCMEKALSTGADAVYSDQETVDERGKNIWTFYKPDWSPEYFRHVMYVGHLLMVRRSLVMDLAGMKKEFDGVQDFEFMLRLSEVSDRIEHAPGILYQWRAVRGSLALATDAKKGISELQARAVQAHLDRLGIGGVATPHPDIPHRCRIIPQLKVSPRVSIIIPTKDQPQLIGKCLESIFTISSYPDFEVIAVDSGTTDSEALAILERCPIKTIPFSGKFNFSKACNLGAAAASGEILVFLNNDTEVISADWLEHMVFHLLPDDVGAVGPLLLYPNGKVQHAGVVLGARGTADHVMRNFPDPSDGYAGSLSCPREVSAVTAACLAVRKPLFDDIGGFSEMYATHYQDVDFCLRLRRRSLRCIHTPDVRLFHHESPSRGWDKYDFLDRLLFIDTWRDVLCNGDPYYHQAFSLEKLDYSTK